VVPFKDLHAIGNWALYLLISSRTDSYFQRAIKQFEPFDDKASELLQEQCTHIRREDKSYFHGQLVGLYIWENESASSCMKCFTYAKTTAEAASNTYTDEQLAMVLVLLLVPLNATIQLHQHAVMRLLP